MTRLKGLIAATYTPLAGSGAVCPDVIPDITDHLIEQGVTGLYVCGSTGEGMSLTTSERMEVAAAYAGAADDRVPVIVQVGHNSIRDAEVLAEHAQEIGAVAVSATCPSYFKVSDVATLTDCMARIAGAAPELPFYYYHIPSLTGSAIDPSEFLRQAGERIPNLAGLKYTDTKLFEFQVCLELQSRAHDVVWGCDEMLLGALATGAEAAIGSTYNFAAPLYQRLIRAFESGDISEARRLQLLSVEMIRTIGRYPFHPAVKQLLSHNGFPMGDCRLPQTSLSGEQTKQLIRDLEAIGFFEWAVR